MMTAEWVRAGISLTGWQCAVKKYLPLRNTSPSPKRLHQVHNSRGRSLPLGFGSVAWSMDFFIWLQSWHASCLVSGQTGEASLQAQPDGNIDVTL
jgi:hypothetical protein